MTSSLQDGSERVIESLSLIDAVMPDVVESRKQQATKNQQQPKAEANAQNGDDAGSQGAGGGCCLGSLFFTTSRFAVTRSTHDHQQDRWLLHASTRLD